MWPLQVKFEEAFDNTFILLLQLACVLHMKTDWKFRTTIRLFIVTPGGFTNESTIVDPTIEDTLTKEGSLYTEDVVLTNLPSGGNTEERRED